VKVTRPGYTEAMRRKTTKIFVDSRFAIYGDGTASILFEIPGGGVELGPHARCYVSEFTCVAAWATIDETNRYQTVVEDGTPRMLALPTGAHDLDSFAAALEEQLGAGYTVERVSAGTGGSTFRLLQVSREAGNFGLPESPMSKIVRFPGVGLGPVQTSSFVDLRRCHNIFVHSPSFGNYNAVAPGGIRTCLCKIPVDTGYGGLVRWSTSGSEYDYIECGVRSLHTLRLELRDGEGQLLDLAGTSFSLTLLFSEE